MKKLKVPSWRVSYDDEKEEHKIIFDASISGDHGFVPLRREQHLHRLLRRHRWRLHLQGRQMEGQLQGKNRPLSVLTIVS